MAAIPFNLAGPLGDEQRYVAEVLTAPGAIDAGKYTALCERSLEKRLRAPRILLTPSGTAALEMCAPLTDIKPGAEVVIDDISIGIIAGSTLDYAEDLASAGFEIKNPNATAKCGCGNSFSVSI